MTELSGRKGAALEDAVRAIEEVILRSAPGYTDKTFRVEARKLLTVNGVRHEVDLLVTMDLGNGYDARFIFECKNWKDPVDKNEIIVFAEKVKALKAQKGFFVAKALTKDATAQAAMDPRVELLEVASFPIDQVEVPLNFHLVHVADGPLVARLDARIPGRILNEETRLDLEAATVLLDGAHVDLDRYVQEWFASERDSIVNRFPSGDALVGDHHLHVHAERTFEPGEATLDGGHLARMVIEATVTVTVVRPTIVSAFEVKNRGRVVSLIVNAPTGASIGAVFVGLAADDARQPAV